MKKILVAALLFFSPVMSAQIITIADPDLKLILLQAGNEIPELAKDESGNPITIDSNEDGQIQASEALAVWELNLMDISELLDVESAEGIQHFTNLRKLVFQGTYITELPVAPLINLEHLECLSNYIHTLDVTGNTQLKTLNCDGNDMVNLYVHGLENLEYLSCMENDLETLDLTGLSGLKTLLTVSNVYLTALDVSGLSSIEVIDCSSNNLTTLDVSGLATLRELSTGSNFQTSLVLTGCVSLKNLNCIYSNVSEIDFTGLVSLEVVHIFENPVSSLVFANHPSLKWVTVQECNLSSITLENLPAVEMFHISWNNLTSVDVSDCPVLDKLILNGNPITDINVANGENTIVEIQFFDSELEALEMSVCTDEAELEHYQTLYAAYDNIGVTVCTMGTDLPDAIVSAIYPNPTNDLVTIQATSAIKSIELYDLQGRLLQTTLVKGTDATFNLSGRAAGVYFVKVTTERGVKVEKIINE